MPQQPHYKKGCRSLIKAFQGKAITSPKPE
jgi:hypothetical protein